MWRHCVSHHHASLECLFSFENLHNFTFLPYFIIFLLQLEGKNDAYTVREVRPPEVRLHLLPSFYLTS